MTKIKNMHPTPTETSVVKGLVSHGMTKDLSKEIYRFMKEFVSTSANASPTAGKSTSTKAPQGPEYATKVDLLTVKMELKDEISKFRIEVSDKMSTVEARILSSQNAMIKWIVGVYIAQIPVLIGIIKYVIR